MYLTLHPQGQSLRFSSDKKLGLTQQTWGVRVGASTATFPCHSFYSCILIRLKFGFSGSRKWEEWLSPTTRQPARPGQAGAWLPGHPHPCAYSRKGRMGQPPRPPEHAAHGATVGRGVLSQVWQRRESHVTDGWIQSTGSIDRQGLRSGLSVYVDQDALAHQGSSPQKRSVCHSFLRAHSSASRFLTWKPPVA